MLLGIGIKNALSQLRLVLHDYASGELSKPHHPHAIAVLYRKLGVCRMLEEESAEPLFVAQMQSVSAYLWRLPSMSYEDKVTSRSAVFFDAVGGQYWDAAAEIARHSRDTVNSAWEHEDDFLYVWFLMQRYFLDAEDERLQHLLDRWEAVLEGSPDPRHQLCDALLRCDADDFASAFQKVADSYAEKFKKQIERRELPAEDAVWVLPWWGEGLALLRLAERDGLQIDENYSIIPEFSRRSNLLEYDSQAWMHIDFHPRLKA